MSAAGEQSAETAQMSEAEEYLWDELWDTDAARCCSCPSCNFYAPDYEQHKDEPCVLRTITERIIAARLYVELRQAADYLVQPGNDIHPLSQAKGARDTHLIGWREGREWAYRHLRDRADAALGERELPSTPPAGSGS